eukprot:TRINITY_DN63743_c0_g1_i1.p2 TRINITY_DN63743_c0_g1~~TRINITY_DN63743_c0_g1_i1.p2  ORF type:complete len:161 (-),score=30.38 TRINITY_DN63743_c0_g1_i1:32-514(-)
MSDSKRQKTKTSKQPIRFFCADYCPFAQRVWIALNALEIEYEYCEVNLFCHRLPRTIHFREISPSRTVPTLLLHGETKGRDDSIPLLCYLDALSGGRLTPTDPAMAWKMSRFLHVHLDQLTTGFYRFLGHKTAATPDQHHRQPTLLGICLLYTSPSPRDS